MGTGILIKNRTDFENLIQTQVKKGQDLLKRNISEDSTTIINKRVGYVFKSKEYDGVIYISYDSNGGWKNSIAKEIQANGLTFNINALLK